MTVKVRVVLKGGEARDIEFGGVPRVGDQIELAVLYKVVAVRWLPAKERVSAVVTVEEEEI